MANEASQDTSKIVAADQQIPRNSLALIMISQIAVIAPISPHISFWIVAVWLVCGYWRMQVYRGLWGYPPGWVKLLMVIAASLGIALTGYTTFSLEAASSLLVVAFTLKLVEMRSRRDAYLVIFLSYFLVAVGLLFAQGITNSVYALLGILVATSALVGMNQMQAKVRPLASFRTAAALLFQAIPLTIVLFLLFPRIGPQWSIPLPSAASTGLSEQMRPGDVASLTRTDDLAFRVEFSQDVPAYRDLYWRGLVYSEFVDGTWRVDKNTPKRQPAASSSGLEYEVFLEPTQSNWLYSLDTPVAFSPSATLMADNRLVNNEPVRSLMRYSVRSDVNLRRMAPLSEAMRVRETQFDPTDNPRMQRYAQQLRTRAASDAQVIDLMLQDIEEQAYYYTLNPPTLSARNSVDEFWFDTRRGFCTHYAGAMVIALRAVDIPARLVGGYQGGEINALGGHVVVRQYQAHAWVEAWLDDAGWVRVDPTAAVAPARIEQGLEAALSGEDRASLPFFSAARMESGDMLNGLIAWADSLEHSWNLWVVGYDKATQTGVLRDLLGSLTPLRIGIALLVGGGLSMLLVALTLFWRRRPIQRHPIEKSLSALSRRMARRGLAMQRGESPLSYIERLGRATNTDITALYAGVEEALYKRDAQQSYLQRQRLRGEMRKLVVRQRFLPA